MLLVPRTFVVENRRQFVIWKVLRTPRTTTFSCAYGHDDSLAVKGVALADVLELQRQHREHRDEGHDEVDRHRHDEVAVELEGLGAHRRGDGRGPRARGRHGLSRPYGPLLPA